MFELKGLDLCVVFNVWCGVHLGLCDLEIPLENKERDLLFMSESIMRENVCGVCPDVMSRLCWVSVQPQHEQKTCEWYEYRRKVLTASSLSSVFGSRGKRRALLKEKCLPAQFKVLTSSACSHGVRYEAVVQKIYEKMTSTKISEYGCIRHKYIEHIGASPDGIVTEAADERMLGRMLEIKVLYSRALLGLPKYGYWVQVQTQLETCDLEYCDFFECVITRYEKDVFFSELVTGRHVYYGVLLEALDVYGKKSTYNSEHGQSAVELELWYEELTDKLLAEEQDITTINFWVLTKYSMMTIQRNRKWFDSVRSQIADFWGEIEYSRLQLKANPDYFEKEDEKQEDMRLEDLPGVGEVCFGSLGSSELCELGSVPPKSLPSRKKKKKESQGVTECPFDDESDE